MNSLAPQRMLHRKFLASLAVALTVAACGGGGGGGGEEEPVALDDENGLMAALDNKVTSNGSPLQQVTGQPPVSNATTPKVEDIPDATAVPGDKISLPINLAGAPNLAALYAKVPGAGSYFEATIAPSGGKAATGSFVAVTTVDFQIDVPTNLETGGQFCIEVKFADTGANVGEPQQACVTVVDTPPAEPTDDQPTAATLGSKLLGTWATNCINIETEESTAEDYKSAKLLLGFSSGKVFSESVELFLPNDCSSTPDSFAFIDGVWSAGASEYNEQSRRWQRPFDFNPNDPDPSIDFEPCYNLLSLNANATELYLGLPLTFTFDDGSGQGPAPGDCTTEDTRPAAVITGLPFIKR